MTVLDADSGTVYMDERGFLEQCVFRLAILRKLEAVRRDLEAWEERTARTIWTTMEEL